MLNAETVGDMTDQVVNKKDNLLERLNKRNKDRQNDLDVKLEQRNKENLQIEGEDYFAQAFAERVRDIELRIDNVSVLATKKTTSSSSAGDAPSNTELGHIFAEIVMDIQELQRYLTSSTMFLTDFKIKACQNILNDLTNLCEETRIRLMPKKKFGFAGKKVTPKILLNPKVHATDKVDGIVVKRESKTFIWTLANRKDEYIYLTDNDVNGQDITISNLKNCLVELQGHPGSVQISNANNCTFLCGPISRSIFAENCQNCNFAVACQQLRLHSSSKCRIYLSVTCRAIIEDCKNIEITDYNYDYPTIDYDFKQAGLDRTINNYTDIADFNWLSPDVASPNWNLIKETQPKIDWNQIKNKFKDGNNGKPLQQHAADGL